MSIVCTICQDLVTERPQSLPDEEELQINAVTCGHLFHRSCILEWFRKFGNQLHGASGKCPVCKADVTLGIRILPSGEEDSTKMDHEILKFEFKQKVQKNDQLQRQLLEKNKILDLSEEIIDKLTSERHDALEKLKIMESQLSVQKIEQDAFEEANKSYQTDGRTQTTTFRWVAALDISANSEFDDQDWDWSSPEEVTNDHLDDDIDGFMMEEETDVQSNHTEEFSDAWSLDV